MVKNKSNQETLIFIKNEIIKNYSVNAHEISSFMKRIIGPIVLKRTRES